MKKTIAIFALSVLLTGCFKEKVNEVTDKINAVAEKTNEIANKANEIKDTINEVSDKTDQIKKQISEATDLNDLKKAWDVIENEVSKNLAAEQQKQLEELKKQLETVLGTAIEQIQKVGDQIFIKLENGKEISLDLKSTLESQIEKIKELIKL